MIPKVEFIDVKKYFHHSGVLRKRYLRAVNGVSFQIKEGETLAVVGESGCGKTTLARMLMKLHDPTGGKILVDGRDISGHMRLRAAKSFRSGIQMIFQDPFASLNPSRTVLAIVGRAITLHNKRMKKEEVRKRVEELMTLVGLTPPDDFMTKYPGQLSGGQRQRIVIARALAVEPAIIVADEPTSMLDVSIGVDIMNLLIDLREKKKLTMVYITHNLASARYLADDMVVMYAGNAVEYGDIDQIIADPYHPYTVLLLNSTPEPFRAERVQIRAAEDLPDLLAAQRGCLFANRCPVKMPRCEREIPGDYRIGGRVVKCFLYESGVPEPIDVRIYA
ncbi:MAG: ABC transporter ATP-binding protein [Christensenellales bacterium]|jgi:peptide/nickel transport system ATP-binding protein